MAGTTKKGSAVHGQYKKEEYGRVHAYVDGTAVRRLDPVPEKVQKRSAPQISAETKQNRAAAVVTVLTCVNYLQLQAKGTRLQKQVTALETQLDQAKLENDSNYNQIMAGVDMEHIKDIAMNEYGMTYAAGSQIVEYELQDNDYVRQYSDVPEE